VRSFGARRAAAALLGVFVTVTAAFAADPVGDAAAADQAERSFLWRAVRGDRSVYLLGSIHFMKSDAYPLSPAIEGAYGAAGLVVFETDIEGLSRAATSLMAAGAFDDGTTLDDVIPEDLYDAVEKRLESLGMKIDAFARTRPWMLALTLTSMELARAGYLGSEGIDAHFSARAERDGKVRRGLETIEEQVSLFADLSAEDGADFLRYTLGDLDSVIPLVDDLVSAWKRGDSNRLEELLIEGFDEHPAIFERFVVRRNHRWMEAVEELFEGEADAMVVVGALHLVGDQGLVELLRGKGTDVEQL
jgi:uncharacterized protein YbaP (TraB family)